MLLIIDTNFISETFKELKNVEWTKFVPSNYCSKIITKGKYRVGEICLSKSKFNNNRCCRHQEETYEKQIRKTNKNIKNKDIEKENNKKFEEEIKNQEQQIIELNNIIDKITNDFEKTDIHKLEVEIAATENNLMIIEHKLETIEKKAIKNEKIFSSAKNCIDEIHDIVSKLHEKAPNHKTIAQLYEKTENISVVFEEILIPYNKEIINMFDSSIQTTSKLFSLPSNSSHMHL